MKKKSSLYLHVPPIQIYRVEAVCLSIFNIIILFRITIFVICEIWGNLVWTIHILSVTAYLKFESKKSKILL